MGQSLVPDIKTDTSSSYYSGQPTLHRLFREKGIDLTNETQTRFDALPEKFMDFVEAPERFAVQWSEAA